MTTSKSTTTRSSKLANAAPPAPPKSLEDLDIPEGMLFDIALRFLRTHSVSSLVALRKSLKLSHAVADQVFQGLRDQQLIEIRRALAGGDYAFSLTNDGKRLAAAKSEVCRYAGPAPVSLRHYAHVVQAQGRVSPPTAQQLEGAFDELVIDDLTLDRIGSALTSRRPLFLYGPAGNGKTSIMEQMARLFEDSVLIPHAVEVDGQIITVFDSIKHQPSDLELGERIDQRWVCCYRPNLIAAGELNAESLNVNWEEHAGVYVAPLQMKANNGALYIDDFGRQRIPPRELLNRWILPLDRSIDYLSFRHGFSFAVPFQLMLTFATNLEPLELADEAFLRRVPSKVFVASPNGEMFDEVFRRVLRKIGQPVEAELVTHFRDLCRAKSKGGLRGCFAKDILELLVSSAVYRGQAVAVSAAALDAAADMYFAHSSTEAS